MDYTNNFVFTSPTATKVGDVHLAVLRNNSHKAQSKNYYVSAS